MRNLSIILICYCFPIAWILSSPPFTHTTNIQKKTKRHMRQIAAYLKSYYKINKKYPDTLRTFKLFVKSKNMTFSFYDKYANSYDYKRLNKNNYILRGFGEDGIAHGLKGVKDLYISNAMNWSINYQKKIKDNALIYLGTKKSADFFYPAVLLELQQSSNKLWFAKLFRDNETTKQHLIIKNKNGHSNFIIANHDKVEEAFFIPRHNGIIFSATNSDRYNDGIYFWNFNTNKQTNVFKYLQKSNKVRLFSSSSDRYYISLAGADTQDSIIYAYVQYKDSEHLNPREFFSKRFLLTIKISNKNNNLNFKLLKNPKRIKTKLLKTPLNYNIFFKNNSLNSLTETQNNWFDLPTNANINKILINWQNFAEKNTSSPLYPYSLFSLSTLYAQAAKKTTSTISKKEKEILRAYAAEISQALFSSQTAPSYLKAIAVYNYKKLVSGKSLPYKTIKFK